MDPDTKVCYRCPAGVGPQPISNFCRKGKDTVCKRCRYELNSNWAKKNREKNRDKRKEYMRAYRAKKLQETGVSNLPEWLKPYREFIENNDAKALAKHEERLKAREDNIALGQKAVEQALADLKPLPPKPAEPVESKPEPAPSQTIDVVPEPIKSE